jgi:hypothetical protein
LSFSVELGTKIRANYKSHDNTSRVTLNLIPLDERFSPDLPRGRGKSIGGDLDVDEEGYEQIDRNLAITTPWLHWLPTCAHTSWPCQEG